MKIQHKRIQEKSKLLSFTKKLHDYAYIETLIIVLTYLGFGYFLDPKDVCILNGEISYILILLAVITLFHGFESGMLAMGVMAFAMWLFYPSFQYVEFLTTLMMTLLFSEFHYYWEKRINEAEADTQYRNIKLNELSRAFYTLKISHDQLEKNYVTKPMSLRNSIMGIKQLFGDEKKQFNAFLKLLEKSFNVNSAVILYKRNNGTKKEFFDTVAASETLESKVDQKDPLLEKALELSKPIFVSDENVQQSGYIAVIPAVQKEEVVSLLLIEKMPFMSFNRENLTSIAILFEYFFNEVKKQQLLHKDERLDVIEDEEYKYEYFRLYNMYKLYKIDSTSLVIKTDSELLATRLYETIDKLLRSLDMVTLIKHKNLFYVSLLFPLADKAASIGFLNRLFNYIGDVKEDDIEYMTFGYKQIDIYDEYISIDNDG